MGDCGEKEETAAVDIPAHLYAPSTCLNVRAFGLSPISTYPSCADPCNCTRTSLRYGSASRVSDFDVSQHNGQRSLHVLVTAAALGSYRSPYHQSGSPAQLHRPHAELCGLTGEDIQDPVQAVYSLPSAAV